MMKIPADLANAAEASFPTLVDPGNVVFKMRRTQAKGGSNSTAEGKALLLLLLALIEVPPSNPEIISLVSLASLAIAASVTELIVSSTGGPSE